MPLDVNEEMEKILREWIEDIRQFRSGKIDMTTVITRSNASKDIFYSLFDYYRIVNRQDVE